MRIFKPLFLTAFAVALIGGAGYLMRPTFVLGQTNGGNIGTLDQFTSTTSPVSAITQRTFGKAIKITGLTSGLCLTLDSDKILTTTACGSSSGSGLATGTPWIVGQLAQVLDNGTVKSIATSSLGLITTDVAEGTNKYYTDARADARINATSTIGTLTSAPNLGTVKTSLTGIIKASSGVLSAAVSGTDYAPATSGSSILYGNGAGGFSNATIGTGLSFAGGTLSATGGSGSGNVSTSSSETAGRIPFWTSTAATPALLSGGSTNLVWDNTNSRLGIGTSSPTSLLNLSASDAGTTITAASAAMADITNSNSTDGNFSDLTFSTKDASGNTTVTSKIVGVHTSHTGSATSGDLAFLTRNAGTLAEKMRILANGNVGIGTAAPTSPLHVVASTTSGVSILNSVGRGGTITTQSDGLGAGGFVFTAVGPAASNSFLGASAVFGGDLTPNANLTYNLGNTSFVWNNLYVQTVTGRPNAAQGTLNLRAGTASNPITFGIGSTEYARLNNYGNFGIGTTSPQGRLTISQASTTDALWIGTPGSSTPSFVVKSANSNGYVGIGIANPTSALHISGDETITDANGNWFTTSGGGTAAYTYSVGRGLFNIQASGATRAQLSLISSTGALALADSSATQVSLRANAASYINGGNLGLGTTSPYAQLSLGGGNLVIGAATAGGTPGDLFLPKLGTAAGTFLAVDATGKVIATTTPSSGGITSLNGLTASSQTFATTSNNGGWGFSSVTSTHTLNIPTASATNPLGLLSNTDWSTFNGKYSPVGTTGQLPYFSGSNTLIATSSLFLDSSGNVGIGTTTPFARLSAHLANGINLTSAFNIGSSTSATTTTLFDINNVGGAFINTATGTVNFISPDQSASSHMNAVTSNSFTQSCAGTETILVGVEFATGTDINTITLNGVAMTKVSGATLGGATFDKMYLYYGTCVAGSNTIAITNTGGANFIYADSASYYGVNTASPIDASASTTATTASLTGTVTTSVSTWIAGVVSTGATGNNISAGTNTVIRSSNNQWNMMVDSNALRASGSNSLNVTATSQLMGMILVGLVPANTVIPAPTAAPSGVSLFISSAAGYISERIDAIISGIYYTVQSIDKYGHLATGGPVPTVNTCTGATINGDDRTGVVTMTSATSCSFNFANTYPTAPACTVGPQTSASTIKVTTTSTSLSVTFGTAQTSFSYICQYHQ